jgi:hypothetical protein
MGFGDDFDGFGSLDAVVFGGLPIEKWNCD